MRLPLLLPRCTQTHTHTHTHGFRDEDLGFRAAYTQGFGVLGLAFGKWFESERSCSPPRKTSCSRTGFAASSLPPSPPSLSTIEFVDVRQSFHDLEAPARSIPLLLVCVCVCVCACACARVRLHCIHVCLRVQFVRAHPLTYHTRICSWRLHAQKKKRVVDTLRGGGGGGIGTGWEAGT